MEVIFLVCEKKQHLCAHDADANAGMQHFALTLRDVHIVQLESVATVHYDIPVLIHRIEVYLGVDTRDLALGAQINVHSPVRD